MKIMVLGGNRFFGKRLVGLLLDSGHSVTVVNRSGTWRGHSKKGTPECVAADRNTLTVSHPAVQRYDAVFDQCCFSATEARHMVSLLKDKVGNYIFTSSLSVYGLGVAWKESDFDPLTLSELQEADAKENYSLAKKQAESVFLRGFGSRLTCVRFPIVCGNDDYTERLRWHVERKDRLVKVPNPKARISLIHASHAALCLAGLIELPPQGPLNICAELPMALERIYEHLRQQTGAECTTHESEGEQSPFGVQGDWFMDATKARDLKLPLGLIEEWLPQLLAEYVSLSAHIENLDR